MKCFSAERIQDWIVIVILTCVYVLPNILTCVYVLPNIQNLAKRSLDQSTYFITPDEMGQQPSLEDDNEDLPIIPEVDELPSKLIYKRSLKQASLQELEDQVLCFLTYLAVGFTSRYKAQHSRYKKSRKLLYFHMHIRIGSPLDSLQILQLSLH